MNLERNIDTLFAEELDKIAAEKQYILEAGKRLESEFISRPPKKIHSVRNLMVAAGAAAAVVAVFVTYSLLVPTDLTAMVQESEQPVVTGSWISSENSTETAVAFSDGSEIKMNQNTEMRVQSLENKGAHLLLERGNIDVAVVHRSVTDWKFDAGPFRIHITGTRFLANWVPETRKFVVGVTEGSVEVDGPMLEEGKTLASGDRIEVSLLDEIVEITKKDRVERIVSKKSIDQEPEVEDVWSEVEETKAPEAGASASVRRPVRKSRIRRPSTSWQTLARKGHYEDALAAVNTFGYSRIVGSGTVQELMLLGDTARFSRRHKMASDVYKTVRRRFPKSREAGRAAFTLGRISLENNGDPRSAARWFEACYRENRKGTMAREAAGRLMEALQRARDTQSAKRAATEYLSRYPNGPHAKLAEKILAITKD